MKISPAFGILVSGTRHTYPENEEFIENTLNQINKQYYVSLVVEGGSRGVDTIAKTWALSRSIPSLTVPAQWSVLGKSAGVIRNRKMLSFQPDLVIAFPCPQSIGTRHCIIEAKKQGLKVLVYEINNI